MPDTALTNLFGCYATLRGITLSLEDEKDKIGKNQTLALNDRRTEGTALYRTELRTHCTTEYPLDRLREVFVDAASLEVSTIDRKEDDAPAQANDLDAQVLQALTLYGERTPSMGLVPA